LVKKKGRTKVVISVIAIIAIVAVAYLALAYPSTIVTKTETISSVGGVTSVPFSVGFPKSAVKVTFTVYGTTGVYSVELRNSTNKVVWSIGVTAVPASTTTTESVWLPAAGNYTVQIGYLLASMTYTVTVTAKGSPW
jgi:hypothetical protein